MGTDTTSLYPTMQFIEDLHTISINNLSGHPIGANATAISNSNLYNDGLSHSDGTTGTSAQDKTSGTWTWTVPSNAPNTLYYRCQYHSGMIGSISVVDPATGLKGDDGAQGATGAAGAAGPAGSDGAAGADGAQGATGAAGSDGSQGAKGDQGDQGFQGATGARVTKRYWSSRFSSCNWCSRIGWC